MLTSIPLFGTEPARITGWQKWIQNSPKLLPSIHQNLVEIINAISIRMISRSGNTVNTSAIPKHFTKVTFLVGNYYTFCRTSGMLFRNYLI